MNRKAKKLDAMMRRDGIPVLDLKSKGAHSVPDELRLQMHVEWKLKDSDQDIIFDVQAFALTGKELKVVDKKAEVVRVFKTNLLKRAYLIPMEEMLK